MSSIFDGNQEEVINRLRHYLALLPEEKRKKLAQDAIRMIGTSDPEKLKELLGNQMSNMDKDSLSDALNRFLKENQ